MPGVSTSSIWLRSGTWTPQVSRCCLRVQPWATSVAKAGFSSRAFSRLDLPTPTRPKTATRSRRCFSASNC